MTDDTVPISEMGIGDDDVQEILNKYAVDISSNYDIGMAEVNNDLIDGVAHIRIDMRAGVLSVPEDVENYLIANDLRQFGAGWDDAAKELTIRVTTPAVYETWSGMEEPELGE